MSLFEQLRQQQGGGFQIGRPTTINLEPEEEEEPAPLPGPQTPTSEIASRVRRITPSVQVPQICIACGAQQSWESRNVLSNSCAQCNMPFNVKSGLAAPIGTRAGMEPTSVGTIDLMPVRCSCNKVFDQTAIEEGLSYGMTIKEVMDRLGYVRMCCRMNIMQSPLVVRKQKEAMVNRQISIAMGNMTLENTSGQISQPFPQEQRVTIISSRTPEGGEGICFTSEDTNFMEQEEEMDPFQIAMEQLNGEFEDFE